MEQKAPNVTNASTLGGIRRVILAGIETIEHGDGVTPEIWKMMKMLASALLWLLEMPQANMEPEKKVQKQSPNE